MREYTKEEIQAEVDRIEAEILAEGWDSFIAFFSDSPGSNKEDALSKALNQTINFPRKDNCYRKDRPVIANGIARSFAGYQKLDAPTATALLEFSAGSEDEVLRDAASELVTLLFRLGDGSLEELESRAKQLLNQELKDYGINPTPTRAFLRVMIPVTYEAENEED